MSKERLRRAVAWGTLIAAGAVATASGLSGCGKGKEYCLSPLATSPAYEGDKSPGVTGEYKTWKTGILAAIVNAMNADNVQGYEGTVVSFRNPDDPNAPWRPSDPMGKANDSENLIQLGRGRDDVEFQVAFMGEVGSQACATTPDVKWSFPTPLAALEGVGTKPHWSDGTPPVTPAATSSRPQPAPSVS